MTEEKEYEAVPNYIIVQWEGKNPPRALIPSKWLKKVNAKRYDTFKISFELIQRHESEDDIDD